jgi:hypothetical protein
LDFWGAGLCLHHKEKLPQMPSHIGSHELALVPPEVFVDRMERRWTEQFGMPRSEPLRALWSSTADAFNQSIIEKAHGHLLKTRVLRFPMGSGKTQGACVFAALQAETNATADDQRPIGLLIVTRLTKQVDDIVKDINATVGRPVAIGDYAKKRVTPEELMQADVLVITHAAYEKATSALTEVRSQRWESSLHGRPVRVFSPSLMKPSPMSSQRARLRLTV